jgi:hypothetical protein
VLGAGKRAWEARKPDGHTSSLIVSRSHGGLLTASVDSCEEPCELPMEAPRVQGEPSGCSGQLQERGDANLVSGEGDSLDAASTFLLCSCMAEREGSLLPLSEGL